MSTATTPPPTSTQSNVETRIDVSPASKRRKPVGTIILIVSILVIGGGFGANYAYQRVQASQEQEMVDKHTVGRRSFTVSLKEKGELKAAHSEQVKSEVEGRSTIISLIPEGSRVEKGDLLVELASDEIDDRIQQQELNEAAKLLAFESAETDLEIQRDRNASDIRKAQLQVELAELAMRKYDEGDYIQAKKDAQIAIDQAKSQLEQRQEDFEAAKKLFAGNHITNAEYQADEFAYEQALWNLEKAKLAKDVLELYTHIADRRQKESDVEEAKKELERIKKNAEAQEAQKVGAHSARRRELEITREQLDKLRRQKKNCTIVAPSQGFVVYGEAGEMRYWRGDNQIREGATVYERQVLITLPDTSTMVVSARIHEAKTSRINIGQPVLITVEGLPGRQFTGTVTKIAQLADSQNRWLNPDLKEYETEVTLTEADSALKPGATAHTEILIEEVSDVVAVPTQCVYSKLGHRFVFAYDDGEVTPVEIQLGATGTEWAEVKKGLAVGDQVLLAPKDEHRRLIPEVEPILAPKLPPGMKLPAGQAPGSAKGNHDIKASLKKRSGGKGDSHSGGAAAKTIQDRAEVTSPDDSPKTADRNQQAGEKESGQSDKKTPIEESESKSKNASKPPTKHAAKHQTKAP